MIKIVIVSISGGQGKTTLAALLGRTLAGKGFRTLMVDLDPLHDLTQWLGLDLQIGQTTVIDVLKQAVPMESALYPIPNAEQFWLLPAQESLQDVGSFVKSQNQAGSWGAAVTAFGQGLAAVQTGFDFCVVDTPPQWVGLNEIGLRSADWLIIPAEASFKGCSSLIHTLNLVTSLGLDLEQLLGVIPFRDRWIGSKRSQESRNAIEFMTEEVGETKILPSFRESEVFKRAVNLHTTPAALGEPLLEEAIQAIFQRIVPEPLPAPEQPAEAAKSTQKKPRKPRASNSAKTTSPAEKPSKEQTKSVEGNRSTPRQPKTRRNKQNAQES